MTRPRLLIVIALLFSISSFAQQKQVAQPAAVAGTWDAVINNASKIDVPFKIAILEDRSAAGGLRASIVNGSERIPFSSTEWDGMNLNVRLEQYDGTLTASLSGDELKGEWIRQTSKGVMHYPFRAKRDQAESGAVAPWNAASLAGEWTFTFEDDNSADRIAPARFEQGTAHRAHGAPVEGTIAPVSGDYGLLAGSIRAEAGKQPTFQLSRFDGIHIVLLTGVFQPDGSIKGKLNSQDFTAVRKVSASATARTAEPDSESVTKLKVPSDPFKFSAMDPKTGKPITQDDFKGKAYIVDIFGTWCPNCHDEAPLLVDLYKRYRAEGLEIVGLAYEYVDEPVRNARLLDIYRKKYGIEFPLLIAGTTEDGQIAKTLPQLVDFGAYPTTIFIGPDGKVQKIHAGFAGPATGDRFVEVKKRFEVNTRELLKKPQ